MAVEITRMELSAQGLRAAASQANDATATRQMLAIALVLEGVGRKTAAETCGRTGRRCGEEDQGIVKWTVAPPTNGTSLQRLRSGESVEPPLGRVVAAAGRRAESRAGARGCARARRWTGVVRWRRVDLQCKIEARLTCRDA